MSHLWTDEKNGQVYFGRWSSGETMEVLWEGALIEDRIDKFHCVAAVKSTSSGDSNDQAYSRKGLGRGLVTVMIRLTVQLII
jgi:hypothetical protein